MRLRSCRAGQTVTRLAWALACWGLSGCVSVADVDCPAEMQAFEQQQYDVIVEHFYVNGRNVIVTGHAPRTHEGVVLDLSEGWYAYLDGMCTAGDTMVKAAGNQWLLLKQPRQTLRITRRCSDSAFIPPQVHALPKRF